MAKPKQDKHREQRIEQEIVVDAYDAEERAMGWYAYLENQVRFPFAGKCTAPRARSRPYAKARRSRWWTWLLPRSASTKCS